MDRSYAIWEDGASLSVIARIQVFERSTQHMGNLLIYFSCLSSIRKKRELISAAENIAMGQRTAEEVVKGWMESPGHRQNILTPDFTHIGIGYDKNGI